MFKCDNCGKQTKAGDKQHTLNKTRTKEYEQYRLIYDSKTRSRKKEYYTTTGYEADGETPQFNFTGDAVNTFFDDISIQSRWQVQLGLKYFFE